MTSEHPNIDYGIPARMCVRIGLGAATTCDVCAYSSVYGWHPQTRRLECRAMLNIPRLDWTYPPNISSSTLTISSSKTTTSDASESLRFVESAEPALPFCRFRVRWIHDFCIDIYNVSFEPFDTDSFVTNFDSNENVDDFETLSQTNTS